MRIAEGTRSALLVEVGTRFSLQGFVHQIRYIVQNCWQRFNGYLTTKKQESRRPWTDRPVGSSMRTDAIRHDHL